MAFVRVSFRSLSQEVKAAIINRDKAALDKELGKMKYSLAVKTAAKHHFEKALIQPEIYSVALLSR